MFNVKVGPVPLDSPLPGSAPQSHPIIISFNIIRETKSTKYLVKKFWCCVLKLSTAVNSSKESRIIQETTVENEGYGSKISFYSNIYLMKLEAWDKSYQLGIFWLCIVKMIRDIFRTLGLLAVKYFCKIASS